jgi:nucleoside-diphosphate-sugar epimerase
MSMLVTGGAGFVGSHIARKFVDEGWKVICLDLKPRKIDFLEEVSDRIEMLTADLTSLPTLLDIVKEKGVRGIVHAAAIPAETACMEKPVESFKVNVGGTLNVVETARLNKLKVVHVSSQAVYGAMHEQDLRPIKEEETLPPPRGMYPMHKVVCEQICDIYNRKYGVDVVSLRTNWVYGPAQNIENPISMILAKVMKGEPFESPNGGDHPIAYTYVKDLVNAAFLAFTAQNLKHRVFNIDSGEIVTVKKIIEVIRKAFPDATIEIGSGYMPQIVRQAPIRGPGDLTRARKELRYEPKYPVTRGIEEFINWLRKQQLENS